MHVIEEGPSSQISAGLGNESRNVTAANAESARSGGVFVRLSSQVKEVAERKFCERLITGFRWKREQWPWNTYESWPRLTRSPRVANESPSDPSPPTRRQLDRIQVATDVPTRPPPWLRALPSSLPSLLGALKLVPVRRRPFVSERHLAGLWRTDPRSNLPAPP